MFNKVKREVFSIDIALPMRRFKNILILHFLSNSAFCFQFYLQFRIPVPYSASAFRFRIPVPHSGSVFRIITNERLKQKNYQSSGNANSELSTQRIDDLNKVNNSTLHILSPVTFPKDALPKLVHSNLTDSMTNESSMQRICNEPSETRISKRPKRKVCHEYSKTEGEEIVRLDVKLSTLKEKRKNADQRNCKRLGALPLVDLSNEKQHYKLIPRDDLDPADVYVRDKAKQVHPIKRKKNPFWKHQLRNRPPSLLRRPTKDWLNHLELVHIITTNPPYKDVSSNQKNLQNDQYQPESQTDWKKPITFLPLVGEVLCKAQ